MSNRRKLRCPHKQGGVLPTTLDDEGHNVVTLIGRQGNPDVRRVCELIAESFIGKCPPGQRLEHINGDLTDDSAANLRYVPI